MKYFGGCDVGSTYTKAVILDETGKMVADTTIMSPTPRQSFWTRPAKWSRTPPS